MQIKNVIEILEQKKTTQKPFKVLAEDFDVYYAKLPLFQDDLSIVNEFIASYLLLNWQIPAPETCILDLGSKNMVSQNIENPLANFFGLRGFGSKVLQDTVDANSFMVTSILANRKKLTDELIWDYLKIALFDIWVENCDRQAENLNLLIRESKHDSRIFPIDHTTILLPATSEIYMREPHFNYYNDLPRTLLKSDFVYSIRKRFSNSNELHRFFDKYFEDSITNCENRFVDIESGFLSGFLQGKEYIDRVKNLLFNQNRNEMALKKFYESIET